jgi:predicted transcriptional regulator
MSGSAFYHSWVRPSRTRPDQDIDSGSMLMPCIPRIWRGFFLAYNGSRPSHGSANKKMAQAVTWGSAPVAPSRRSAFEVRMDILRVTSAGPVRRTHIMYRSNTSWIILRKNLEELAASGLIRAIGEDPRLEYSITDAGIRVLKDYNEVVNRSTRNPLESVV